MGVLSVTEIWRPSRGGERDAEGVTRWTRTFLVRTYDTSVTADEIIDAVDLATGLAVPGIGDTYLVAPNVVAGCVRVAPRQDSEDPYHWEVAAEYSTTYVPGAENPLTRPIRLRRDSVPYKEPMVTAWPVAVVAAAPVVAADATPVLNSAGLPPDPPAERDANYIHYTIVRFEDRCPDDNIRRFENTVSAEPFRALGVYGARMTSITYEAVWINGRWYYETTYVIDGKLFPPTGTAPLNAGGWFFAMVDAGYQEVVADPANPGGFTWREIKDAAGRQPSSPWLLNGTGQKQPAPTPGDPGNPVYLSWCPYPVADWTDLVAGTPLSAPNPGPNAWQSLEGPP